jgi:hypothetical protein
MNLAFLDGLRQGVSGVDARLEPRAVTIEGYCCVAFEPA